MQVIGSIFSIIPFKTISRQVSLHVVVIPELGKLRQEDCPEFEANTGYECSEFKVSLNHRVLKR